VTDEVPPHFAEAALIKKTPHPSACSKLQKIHLPLKGKAICSVKKIISDKTGGTEK
jgi:hypothetical protein